MPLSDAGKHIALNALMKGTNPAKFVELASLHDGDPGTTGANELTGGSPAYARKAIAFNNASSGASDDSTNGITFDVPAGSDVSHAGLWASDGTFLGGGAVSAPESFASQGQYLLTDADVSLT
jgi:hypothetical protein